MFFTSLRTDYYNYDYEADLAKEIRQQKYRERESYNRKNDGGREIVGSTLYAIADCISEALGNETAKSFLRNF